MVTGPSPERARTTGLRREQSLVVVRLDRLNAAGLRVGLSLGATGYVSRPWYRQRESEALHRFRPFVG